MRGKKALRHGNGPPARTYRIGRPDLLMEDLILRISDYAERGNILGLGLRAIALLI